MTDARTCNSGAGGGECVCRLQGQQQQRAVQGRAATRAGKQGQRKDRRRKDNAQRAERGCRYCNLWREGGSLFAGQRGGSGSEISRYVSLYAFTPLRTYTYGIFVNPRQQSPGGMSEKRGGNGGGRANPWG